jgi:hypothetical protein
MQTLTIEITHKNGIDALHNLAEKRFIRIVEPARNSVALPGQPISIKEFKDWIEEAENNNTISLKKVKDKWVTKRKQLQRLTK